MRISIELQRQAERWQLNQRPSAEWLRENVDPAGTHFLLPVMWHTVTHRPDVPIHLRTEMVLRSTSGTTVECLLDVFVADLERLPLANLSATSRFD